MLKAIRSDKAWLDHLSSEAALRPLIEAYGAALETFGRLDGYMVSELNARKTGLPFLQRDITTSFWIRYATDIDPLTHPNYPRFNGAPTPAIP